MTIKGLLRIRVLRDLSSTTISTLVLRGLGFLNLVALAHILPPSELGHYIVYVAVAVVLVPVTDAGFFPLVTRVSAERKAATFAVSSRADRLRLPLWSLILGTAILLWAGGVAPPLAPLAVVGAIGQAQTDCMSGELQGVGRYFQAAALRVTNSVLNLAGALVVLAIPTAEVALAVFAIARILPVTLARLVAFTRRARTDGPPLPLSLRAAVPFALYAAITVLYVRCDVFLLGLFDVDSQLVAAYGVVYNVVIALQLVPSALLATAYPRLVVAEKAHIPTIMGLTLAASFTLSALCVAVALAEPQLWLSLFGEFYRQAGIPIAALLVIAIPLSVSQVLTSGLQALRHETRTWQLAVPALILNAGLNIALIPGLGVRGALVATSCAEGALVFWLALQARRLRIFDATPLAFITAAAIACALAGTGPVTSVAILGLLAAAWALDLFRVRRDVYLLARGAVRSSP